MDFSIDLIKISKRMTKRRRESSISIKEIVEGKTIIEWNGNEYSVTGQPFLKDIIGDPKYECEIIHGKHNEATLSIECLRSGEVILLQEIDVKKYRKQNEWMTDVE